MISRKGCTLVSSNRRMPTLGCVYADWATAKLHQGTEGFAGPRTVVTEPFEFHALSVVLKQFLPCNPIALSRADSPGRSSSILPWALRLLSKVRCLKGAQ